MPCNDHLRYVCELDVAVDAASSDPTSWECVRVGAGQLGTAAKRGDKLAGDVPAHTDIRNTWPRTERRSTWHAPHRHDASNVEATVESSIDRSARMANDMLTKKSLLYQARAWPPKAAPQWPLAETMVRHYNASMDGPVDLLAMSVIYLESPATYNNVFLRGISGYVRSFFFHSIYLSCD